MPTPPPPPHTPAWAFERDDTFDPCCHSAPCQDKRRGGKAHTERHKPVSANRVHCRALPAGNAVALFLLLILLHGSHILLGEALAQALPARHGLEDAAADAAVLAARERLGGEVVDARDEAVVDEVGVDLWVGASGAEETDGLGVRGSAAGCAYRHELLHLFPLQALLEVALLVGGEAPGQAEGGLELDAHEAVGCKCVHVHVGSCDGGLALWL